MGALQPGKPPNPTGWQIHNPKAQGSKLGAVAAWNSSCKALTCRANLHAPSLPQELIAGGVAGGAAKTAVAPLERAKILFQVRPRCSRSPMAVAGMLCGVACMAVQHGNRPPGSPRCTSSSSCARPHLATARLLLPCCWKTFTVFSSAIPRPPCRLQTGKLQGASLGPTLRGIYSTEGLPGLFRGNGASVLRIVPYAAVHFWCYEHYRRLLVAAEVLGAQVRMGAGLQWSFMP